MGSWVEKFSSGKELDDFGFKMCNFLQKLKPFITDEKLKRKIKRMQVMFLENSDEIKFYK